MAIKDGAQSTSASYLKPLCLIVLGGVALFIVAGVIALALIPIYLNDRGVHMTIKNSCKEQTLVFVIPGNLGVQDGVMSQEKTAQLGTILQSQIQPILVNDLKTSQITVTKVEVTTHLGAPKKKRDIPDVITHRLEDVELQPGDQLLSVTCRQTFTGSNAKVCTSNYQRAIRKSLSSMNIPLAALLLPNRPPIILPNAATTKSPATSNCTDTKNYAEAITGYTCQTYSDYRKCYNGSVVPASGIDYARAKANCCVCGKNP